MSAESPEPRASTGGATTPKLYRGLKRALDRPGADRAVVIVSLLLMAFSLDTKLSGDDYVHEMIARGSHALPGFVRPPLDLYRFADASTSPELKREGVLGWWDDPDARLAFLRPLSALTHILDYRLYPEHAWLMHLHSLLWSALLLAGLLALYRALLPSVFVCALAMFVYALDDARGWLVSWVAGRNAAVATAITVWALVFHVRWRAQGSRTAAVLASALFVLGLLAGEGATAILGYVFAYAVCLDRGTWRQRLLSLAPYAAIVLPWRVLWRAYGYGVAHSGLYFDPLATPLDFLRLFGERAPILLFSQLGGVWSDIWNILFAFPWFERTLLVTAYVIVGVFGYALWPLVRRDPTVRFAVIGAAIAVVPACAAFLADRLLTWISIGGSIAIAKLIHEYCERPEPLRADALRALLLAPLVLALLAAKAVIDPVFLPSRARGNLIVRDNLDRAQAGIPSDPSIRSKRVVYVNSPGVPLCAYIPVERAAQGVPRAESQVYLATGEADLRLTRIDAASVRVRQRGGFLQSPGSHLLRDPRRPSKIGDEVQLDGVTIEVTDLMADGRPAEIVARFDPPLDDPRWYWIQWKGRGYEPFPPLAIGETRVLPALDLAQVLIGDLVRLPFDGRLAPAPDPGWTQSTTTAGAP